jgi:carbamoyl-phosphate synthase large subunit
MPRRTDIQKILIIGSGPIVIGQACEFDYSGTQGCKALREDGYTVILVNSNPATIMTDPEFGDRTYIEPITPEIVAEIIKRERPDALLPTLGGQTGLNTAIELHRAGVLAQFGVELIGAKADAIERSEDRLHFKRTMESAGIGVPRSGIAYNLDEAQRVVEEIGFPCVIRPSYTLGGTGGGVAYNIEEFVEVATRGLSLSLNHEIMVEQSVIGWKEYELEVMRDCDDNFVVICSIENFDPMGVHTGDSITVAPAQTLTDREYQAMRDDARRIISAIGVDTGGSNIQFAVNPHTGERLAIEMNPRVSRSSALASKATGFPIAKIAAKLAVGYRLDELLNDITKKTPASFEPTIDYCVVKIPRFTFEKFPGAEPLLGTQMKSVGETMSIGRTFKEALQKGLRSLEIDRMGFGADGKDKFDRPACLADRSLIRLRLKTPNPQRIFYLKYALLEGFSTQEIFDLTGIDPWFIENLREIVEVENDIGSSQPLLSGLKQFEKEGEPALLPPQDADSLRRALWRAKQNGFSDFQIAFLTNSRQEFVRALRAKLDIHAVFKAVDTCAGEFEAETPYFYSTYERENESRRSARKKIVILGGGPNRIGQGIEFDYCCVQAVFALKAEGYEAIMVNSNPETVSTDYDTSDKLYFEPLTVEDVLNIVENEQPEGVIVQFGGQTPLKLARALDRAGVRILGSSFETIDIAEDRERFGALLGTLGILQPENGTGRTYEEVRAVAHRLGYPVMVRPSYVLGGRAMDTVYDDDMLEQYMRQAVEVSPEHPVLIDKFLDNAVEIDVDALADGERVTICAIMEHIEEAGIHSGDSACVIPTRTLSEDVLRQIRRNTEAIGLALCVKGLMNIQYAVKDGQVYVLEVNPRASRTVPYVSKTIGVPVAKLATRIMIGKSLAQIGFTEEPRVHYYSVKEAVLPFAKFPGCDIILGPEMRSTGEVMGIDTSYGLAFAKSQAAAYGRLPTTGAIFISINDQDKPKMLPIARRFRDLGFRLFATQGTSQYLRSNGVENDVLSKLSEGRPNVVDRMINNEIQLVINTFSGKVSKMDGKAIRSTAIARGIPLLTTIAAARAAADGIAALKASTYSIKPLQLYHAELHRKSVQ